MTSENPNKDLWSSDKTMKENFFSPSPPQPWLGGLNQHSKTMGVPSAFLNYNLASVIIFFLCSFNWVLQPWCFPTMLIHFFSTFRRWIPTFWGPYLIFCYFLHFLEPLGPLFVKNSKVIQIAPVWGNLYHFIENRLQSCSFWTGPIKKIK